MLTQVHRAFCVDWAESNRCRDWEKVVLSYEMSIWLADSRIYVMCWGDSKTVKPSVKPSPKLHVWEAFSARQSFLSRYLRKV